MGLVYSDKMKEWCQATLQGYALDGIPVPLNIDNFCHRVLYGNGGKVVKTFVNTRHNKKANIRRKSNRRKIRHIRRSNRRTRK
jgi:hypothetical protein